LLTQRRPGAEQIHPFARSMLFTADGPNATRRTTHPHLERAVVALQYVRVFAVDAVLAGATAEDGAAVAAAVELIDDRTTRSGGRC